MALVPHVHQSEKARRAQYERERAKKDRDVRNNTLPRDARQRRSYK